MKSVSIDDWPKSHAKFGRDRELVHAASFGMGPITAICSSTSGFSCENIR